MTIRNTTLHQAVRWIQPPARRRSSHRNTSQRHDRRTSRWMLLAWLGCGALSGCTLPGTSTQNQSLVSDRIAVAPQVPNAATNQGSNPMIHSPTMGKDQLTAQDLPAIQNTPAVPAAEIQQVGYHQRIGDGLLGGHVGARLQGNGLRASGCGTAGCQACASGNCGSQGCAPIFAAWQPHHLDPQEFLCDGGDHLPHAYLRRDDTIAALDPEDTVVHYTTDAGDVEFAQSNRVCVYSPRFAAVRRITGAVAGQKSVAAVGMENPVGPVRIDVDQPGLVVSDAMELGHADTARRIDAMRDRNRGVRVEGVLQPISANDILAAVAGIRVLELNEIDEAQLALLQESALAAIAWSIEESVEAAIQDLAPPVLTRDQALEGFTRYDFGEGRLLIGKFADKNHAQPGEVVTFMLRVDNVGDGTVNQVVITDNLTTRLDYIPDSEEASCEAEFEAIPNSGESTQLIWTLTEPLKVGESVTLSFKCRVR